MTFPLAILPGEVFASRCCPFNHVCKSDPIFMWQSVVIHMVQLLIT